jgi:protein involved in sex pheromone biosynthesis
MVVQGHKNNQNEKVCHIVIVLSVHSKYYYKVEKHYPVGKQNQAE